MQRNLSKETGRKAVALSRALWKNRGLQAALWVIWTAVVIGRAYLSWYADHAAQRPFNLLGMVVHCAVIGVVGLVVLTFVEIHLEPWRFLN